MAQKNYIEPIELCNSTVARGTPGIVKNAPKAPLNQEVELIRLQNLRLKLQNIEQFRVIIKLFEHKGLS